ncbi:hypothetical protein KDA_45500 [Dictyobacter alpinus]|uniref:FAD-binding domain-containing protein n=1 Tax=Dictyobacter alpinus TaxID=2014873 RepID=A0A402BCK5_9CHLR|nr:FAD-dependent monooxygenase [Dictyobacter alpinus]GCE29066.1 hypothetical protein KDA_45500 [Dictyobacter alpinus]
MNTQNYDVDVLIIGAGPVGLTMAHEVQRHGLSCRILDQKLAPSETSRALGVFNRTLEVFETMGMVDKIIPETQPVHFLNVYARKRHLTQVSFESRAFETPFAYPVFCSQVHVEEVLRTKLYTHGVAVEWGTRLVDFQQDTEGVSATIQSAEESTQQIQARWLIGCDGGHSLIRKQLHLPFNGSSDETWLIIDVELDWSLPKDSVYGFFGADATVMAYPFPEGKRWRLLTTHVEEQTDPASVSAQFARIINSVYADEPVIIPEPLWLSIFTIQQRHVPNMRAGRSFVVGDAAHVHSPASGQGMNTGIQDAFNLAWKLALVIHNQASEHLLDSYSLEREPIAQNVLRGAKVFTRVLSQQYEVVQQVRNTILNGFYLLPFLRPFYNQQVSAVLSGFAHNYRQSPFVAQDWQVEGRNVRALTGITPGDRLPDIRYGVDSTRRLYDLTRGVQHSALLFVGIDAHEQDQQQAAHLLEQLVQRHDQWLQPYLFVTNEQVQTQLRKLVSETYQDAIVLDQYGILHRRFGAEHPTLYIIRPDGYIGYRNQPASIEQLEHYANAVLGIKQTIKTS